MSRMRSIAAAACASLATSGCAALSFNDITSVVTPTRAGALAIEPTHCGAGDDALAIVHRRHPPSEVSCAGGRAAPLLGAADYQIRQFSNFGFGGRVVWGKSFDPNGISAALSSCGAEGLCTDKRETTVCEELV